MVRRLEGSKWTTYANNLDCQFDLEADPAGNIWCAGVGAGGRARGGGGVGVLPAGPPTKEERRAHPSNGRRAAAVPLPSRAVSAVRRTLPAAEGAGVWALAQGANMALAILEFLFAILIVITVLQQRFFSKRVTYDLS